MIKVTDSPKYRAFVNNRDRTLEGFLLKARAKVADDLRQFMAHVETEFLRTYPLLNLEFLDPQTQNKIKALDLAIDRHAYTAALTMSQHWITLRYIVAALTNAGEQQALINVIGGDPKKISSEELLPIAYEHTELGSITDRSYLWLSRMRRSIIDAVEMARILSESPELALKRVQKVFPNIEYVKRNSPLVRVKEANVPDRKKSPYILFDFIDADEWDAILDEYKREFVPKWRDPKTGKLPEPVSIGRGGKAIGVEDGFAIYPWQLEYEMTEDFVSLVSKGQHEGAKKQGITQFVWIAVVDNRTDDCCLKRDGLTNKEIQSKLKGAWAKDECRAVVPPAHFNCRCRLAPATDSLPEIPESNEAEFEAWLNS